MVSEQFRRQLRQESQVWRAEGIISEEVYAWLSSRYQFEGIEQGASYRYVAVLMGLGGVLLGLGVITFVAANWQGWPRSLKIIVLLSSLLTTNLAGLILWRSPAQRWPSRLGSALLLLGAFLLGANLALMSQMFHLDGPLYQLYLVWGLGVGIIGVSLPMTLLSMVSLLLLSFAYVFSLQDWWVGLPGIGVILHHGPLFLAILGILWARWCDSRVMFGLILVALIPTVWIQIISLGEWPMIIKLALMFSLPPAFLWSYRDTWWDWIPLNHRPFQSLAQGLGLFLLGLQLYVLSFHGWWTDWDAWGTVDEGLREWWLSLDVLGLMGITLWNWFQLMKPQGRSPDRWRSDRPTLFVFTLLSLTAGIVIYHWFFPLPILAPFLINTQLFLLAVVIIRLGLSRGKRLGFWTGLLLLTLQIISRMLEYDTGLLLKSIVFIVCGIAVMLAGLWFERNFARLRSVETPHR